MMQRLHLSRTPMALHFDITPGTILLWLVLLLLFPCGTVCIPGASFAEFSLRQESSSSTGPLVLSVVAPALALSLMVTVSLVLVLLVCLIRKMRQVEGTYQPRKEEETGASRVETPDVLKLPKKERLI